MMHLLPYAAYLAEPSVGGHRLEINESRFHDLIRSVLNGVQFDEQWYRQRYRDVDTAVQSGELGSAFEHYCKVGYFEGRLPREVNVDQEWYLKIYADVRGAIRRGNVESAQEHFELYGYAEGRLPREGWTLSHET